MIQFNLEKKWFDKIKSGEKKIEYREFKPYWTKRFEKIWGTIFWTAPIYFEDNTFPCILRLGYTKTFMKAQIVKMEVVDGLNTDLKVDKKVIAIYLDQISEVKKS